MKAGEWGHLDEMGGGLADWSRGGVGGQALHGLSRAVTVCSCLGHFQNMHCTFCCYMENLSENIIKYHKQADSKQIICLLAYYATAK